MGDTTSWLIFLIGLLALAVFGIAVLGTLAAGVIFLLKRWPARKATQLVKDAKPDSVTSEQLSDAHAAYNVVSDTIVGLNVRKNDNRFQAVFILVTVLLLAAAGGVAAMLNDEWGLPWIGGALIGAFAGLVIGVITSGILLMFYRAVRHIQGQHE